MSKTNKQVISGYHRPVCPKCERELHPEKNGVGVLDMAGDSEYEVYDADLWACPSCGMEVIGGFGNGPISAHYEENFQKVISNYKILFRNKG